MTIEQKINQDFMSAFKNREMDRKDFLGILKGEFQTQKKNLVVENLSDEQTQKILAKFIKGIKENIELTGEQKFLDQLALVEGYLPKAMGQAEVEAKLDEVIGAGAKNIGDIMKAFAGLPVDKKMLSELAKQKLS